MNAILIIAGVILIAIGIYRISSSQSDKANHHEYQKVVVVKTQVHDTVHDIVTKEIDKAVSVPTNVNNLNLEEKEPEVQPSQEKKKDSPEITEDSKTKGDVFEDFVVNLLRDNRLKLLDRTQDKVSSAGVYAESCKNPDLHVGQQRGNSNVDYYLECKYRSNWKDGAISFQGWQIDRYRQFQRENKRKVLIALGIGGSSAKPARFMLVPLDSIKENSISEDWTTFNVSPSPTSLINYMNEYFDSVFAKSKKKKSPSSNQ